MNELELPKKNTEVKAVSQTIDELIDPYKIKLSETLPKHIDASQFVRILRNEVARNPKLLLCTKLSLMSCLFQIAKFGLSPDSMLGEAFLIPFKNRRAGNMECQLIIGYQGYLTLAYRSGQLVNVNAFEVREKDFFEYEHGTEDYLRFRPFNDPTTTYEPTDSYDVRIDKMRGKILHYAAIGKLKNRERHFIVMSKSDVDHHRSYSKTGSGDYSPWVTHYAEMAKKTAVKKLLKYLPRSAEDVNLRLAIRVDDLADIGKQSEFFIEKTKLLGENNE